MTSIYNLFDGSEQKAAAWIREALISWIIDRDPIAFKPFDYLYHPGSTSIDVLFDIYVEGCAIHGSREQYRSQALLRGAIHCLLYNSEILQRERAVFSQLIDLCSKIGHYEHFEALIDLSHNGRIAGSMEMQNAEVHTENPVMFTNSNLLEDCLMMGIKGGYSRDQMLRLINGTKKYLRTYPFLVPIYFELELELSVDDAPAIALSFEEEICRYTSSAIDDNVSMKDRMNVLTEIFETSFEKTKITPSNREEFNLLGESRVAWLLSSSKFFDFLAPSNNSNKQDVNTRSTPLATVKVQLKQSVKNAMEKDSASSSSIETKLSTEAPKNQLH